MDSRHNSSINVQMDLSMVADFQTGAKRQSWYKVKFVLLCLHSVSAVTFGIKTGQSCWNEAKDKVYLMTGGWYLWMTVPVILSAWRKLIPTKEIKWMTAIQFITYMCLYAHTNKIKGDFILILFWIKDAYSVFENYFNAIFPIYIVNCTKELFCRSYYVAVIWASHQEGSLWVWCAVTEGNLVKLLVHQAELG